MDETEIISRNGVATRVSIDVPVDESIPFSTLVLRQIECLAKQLTRAKDFRVGMRAKDHF